MNTKNVTHKCRGFNVMTLCPTDTETWIALGVENSPGLSAEEVEYRLIGSAVSNDLKRTWASKFSVAIAKEICARNEWDYKEHVGNKEQRFATSDELIKANSGLITDDEAQEIADGIPFPAYAPKKTSKPKKSLLEENTPALETIISMGMHGRSEMEALMTKMGIGETEINFFLNDRDVN